MRVRMRLYLQSFYARRVMMSRCRERLKVPPQHTWVWELESVGSSGLIRGTSAGGGCLLRLPARWADPGSSGGAVMLTCIVGEMIRGAFGMVIRDPCLVPWWPGMLLLESGGEACLGSWWADPRRPCHGDARLGLFVGCVCA